MEQRQILQQLLEDMDTIRPIVIAAMPEDLALRATTRRMISDLESMQQEPSVPATTYLWLSQITARLLDAEHGALLRPESNGEIPPPARQSIWNHTEQRQSLLLEALHSIPAARRMLDQCCIIIGKQPTTATTVQEKARHLSKHLQTHIKHNSGLRQELQQLITALSPSLDAFSTILQEAGEDSPELQQVKLLLEKDLPDDAEQAKQLLQQARLCIVQAGNKLASASKKLHGNIQENMEKLTEMSDNLARAKLDARNDPLTGLANRRHLAEFLNSLGKNSFCVVICDVDNFKNINDTYGHDAGDEILRQLAAILLGSTRSTDLAARIGGEEFCIVFPDTNLQSCVGMAESLRHAVDLQPLKTAVGDIAVTISIGLASHKEGENHAATFKAADKALYQSKENGRNQVSVAEQE